MNYHIKAFFIQPFINQKIMKKITFLIFFLLYNMTIIGQKGNFSIEQLPNWVTPLSYDIKDKDSLAKENNAAHYLLISNQEHIPSNTSVYRYTTLINNNEGVQQFSDISIDYDPSYQKLKFHFIKVIRDGKTINKLHKKEIKTIQRESDMDRYLFNGALTAYINLKDIRANDIIDYSYSIVGKNPIYEDHYHNEFYLQSTIDIGRFYKSIWIPNTKNIHFKYFNNAPQPSVNKSEKLTHYSWDVTDSKAIHYDTNTPSWYDPFHRVQATEYNNWNEVVEQYKKHYLLSTTDKAKLKKEIATLFKIKNRDSLALQIIRFVQDDVRYLGFEDGIHSHKPYNPLKTLEQRYGDCKAKSFLLTEMLTAIGYEAYPMLVHSYNAHNLVESLPSPNEFDHCIVQIKKDNSSYFIDPTINYQGGAIENTYIPNYQYGLVLKDNQNELSPITSQSSNETFIKEEFDIDNYQDTAYLYITSTYTGSKADNQRRYFASNDLEKIQKNYINYYSTLYANISPFSKIEFIDDKDNSNKVIVKEAYSIDSLWLKAPADPGMLYAEFYPLVMEDLVNVTKSPKRTMPYAINGSSYLKQKIIVNLPETFSIENEDKKIDDPGFSYSFKSSSSHKKLILEYEYQSKKSHLTPEETSSYISKNTSILGELSYYLTYNNALAITYKEGILSWQLIFFALIILGISIYIGFRVYKEYDISSTSNQSMPIGGWLVLIAIKLVLSPLFLFVQLYRESSNFLNKSIWQLLTSSSSSTHEVASAYIVIFELMYNVVFFVFSILVTILFFKKRTILPRLIIIYYALVFLVPLIDSLALYLFTDLKSSTAEINQETASAVRDFIYCCIWIPYFLISKRVKNTFTISLKNTSQNEDTSIDNEH